MKTAIKYYSITDYSDYCSVRVVDEGYTEYSLNFPRGVTDRDIRETWRDCRCWKLI